MASDLLGPWLRVAAQRPGRRAGRGVPRGRRPGPAFPPRDPLRFAALSLGGLAFPRAPTPPLWVVKRKNQRTNLVVPASAHSWEPSVERGGRTKGPRSERGCPGSEGKRTQVTGGPVLSDGHQSPSPPPPPEAGSAGGGSLTFAAWQSHFSESGTVL